MEMLLDSSRVKEWHSDEPRCVPDPTAQAMIRILPLVGSWLLTYFK